MGEILRRAKTMKIMAFNALMIEVDFVMAQDDVEVSIAAANRALCSFGIVMPPKISFRQIGSCCPVAILMKTYRACLSCKMRLQQELLEYLVNFWLHSTMLSTSLKSMVHVKTWKIKNSGNSGSLPLITPSILDDNWIRTFT